MYNEEYYTSEELYHYGVLGMKWGVRRGHADKVYAKASKKLAKYDAKASKYQKKALKRTMKADRTFYGRDIYRDLASKSNRKAIKNMRKAEKIVKNMQKALKDTSFKPTTEQIMMGRRYIDSLNTRAAISAYK